MGVWTTEVSDKCVFFRPLLSSFGHTLKLLSDGIVDCHFMRFGRKMLWRIAKYLKTKDIF